MKHFSLSLLLSYLCLFTTSSLWAQKSNPTVDPFCATPTLTEKDRQELEKQIDFAFRLKKASGAITGITYIPIRPHILRRSDGTGGLSLSRLNNILALANSYYLSNGSGLQFYFCGTTPDYIDSDAFYANFNDANENLLANGRDVTNALNMYFVPSTDQGWAGYAYFPANSLSSTRQLILSSLTDDRLGLRTIPHELGHTFALFHTFGNSNGTTPTDELVTRGAGANCSTAGDHICDTPADPYTSSSNDVVQSLSAPGCLSYVGTIRDANNELYSPSLINLMSYYFPCYYEFTNGQYDRIQAGLAARQLHTTYTLTCMPVAVNAPTGLVATIGQTKNVALVWQDNATNEMGYFIERASSAAGPFIGIGGVAPNITAFTDTKVTPGATYYYRIRPSNTTADALSNTATVSVSATPACVPVFSYGCSENDGLNAVWLNGERLSQNSGCSTNGYVEFTGVSATVAAGQVCQISGQFLNGPAAEAIGVWIDVNQNGTYEAGERLYSATITGQFSGTFVIPVSMSAGIGTMRILVTPGTLPSSACASLVYGESEDYSFAIVAPACASPSGLVSGSLTANSASVSWNPASEAASYTLRWKPTSSETWNTQPGIVSTTYSLTGLQEGTAFQWQVQTNCGSGQSPFNGQTFYTPCTLPGGLSTSAITDNSAVISWNSGSTAISSATYEVAWKAVNATIWRVNTVSNATLYALNGLAPGTVYQWKIRNVCTPTSEIVYAGPTNFTTTGSCLPLFSAGCSDADGINSLTFNNIVLSANSGCSVGGYRSVTNVAATITPGTNYTFTISLLSPTYGEHVSIWVDLNRNGSFDATERLFQTTSTVTGTFSGSLAIPAGITPGLLPMRVLARYNAVATDPCGSYSYGEAEDYKLLIVEPTCAAPTGLTTVNVTKTQAQLNFGVSGSYQLQFKPQANADWNTIGIITGSTYILTGVLPNTVYQWRLQRVCSTTAISEFSSIQSFTTADGVCEPGYTAGCSFGDALVAFRFNNTQLSQGSGCSASGYRSFSTVSATVVAGQSYPFSGTFSSTTEQEGVAIWIDFNRNNTFETNERVFQTTSLVTSGISGSVTIPVGTSAGTLRMRVMVVYGLANPTNPCGTYEYGETEDYLLTIPGAVCASMFTVKTGDWTDPTVWSCNRLPTSADAVEIRHAVAIPAAGVGQAQKVSFAVGGGIMYGAGAKLQLGTP